MWRGRPRPYSRAHPKTPYLKSCGSGGQQKTRHRGQVTFDELSEFGVRGTGLRCARLWRGSRPRRRFKTARSAAKHPGRDQTRGLLPSSG